jgi:hypothetical protein
VTIKVICGVCSKESAIIAYPKVHLRRMCPNTVSCISSYNYGHVSRNCLNRRRPGFYRKKSPSVLLRPAASKETHAPTTPSSSSARVPSSPPPLSPATAAEHAATLASMANNVVDPSPLVPRGFVVCQRSREEDTPMGLRLPRQSALTSAALTRR